MYSGVVDAQLQSELQGSWGCAGLRELNNFHLNYEDFLSAKAKL